MLQLIKIEYGMCVCVCAKRKTKQFGGKSKITQLAGKALHDNIKQIFHNEAKWQRGVCAICETLQDLIGKVK